MVYGNLSRKVGCKVEIDTFDRKILQYIQKDCSMSIESLGEQVGLSRNAVWRRVKALEEHGYIKSKVAIIDPQRLGLELQVFVQIRTSEHNPEWRKRLAQTVQALPQIQFVHRMTGDLDYLIMARVANMAEYDQLYQRLTENVQMTDVSASFVMESLKETTEIPVSLL